MKRYDENDSKAAFIWILGEYAEKIEGVEDMLNFYNETLAEESIKVQLHILTAAVKMYLKKPDECEDLVMEILRKSTEESDNPDLRDRGYIYWRMLSTEPAYTKFVVLSDKPEYQVDDNDGYDDAFLDNLIENIGCLSSVYHITPDDIEVPLRDQKLMEQEEAKKIAEKKVEEEQDEVESEPEEEAEEEAPEPKEKKKKKKSKEKKVEEEPQSSPMDDIGDLLGLDDPAPAEPVRAQPPTESYDPLADLMGGGSTTTSQPTGGSWMDNDFMGGGSSSGGFATQDYS